MTTLSNCCRCIVPPLSILTCSMLPYSERRLGPDDPAVAAALTDMGQLLQRQGRLAQAEPLLRRAVEIQEEHHGKAHLQARCRSNHAIHEEHPSMGTRGILPRSCRSQRH